jgi:hypothetical protein
MILGANRSKDMFAVAVAITEELRHSQSAETPETVNTRIGKNVVNVFLKQFVVPHHDFLPDRTGHTDHGNASAVFRSFVNNLDRRTGVGG